MTALETARKRAYVYTLKRAMANGASKETCAAVIEQSHYDRELPTPEQLLSRIARAHYGIQESERDVIDTMEQAA